MGKEVWHLETVVRHVAKAAEWAAAEAATAMRESIELLIDAADIDDWDSDEKRVESPIEAVFMAWWAAVDAVEALPFEGHSNLHLTPQVEAPCGDSLYRVDFEIMEVDRLRAVKNTPRIGVETDGHWHERTPEEVARRNRRDQDLVAAGWAIVHFSGREVLRNPRRCVETVRAHALRLWEMRRPTEATDPFADSEPTRA